MTPSHSPAARDLTPLAWIAIAIVGIGVFVVMTVLLLNHATFGFDRPWLTAAESLRGDGTIWRVISESANIPLIIIGVGIVAGLFLTHRLREAVIVTIMLIAITAGSEAVKQIVARPRPEGTDPNIPGVVYSFPSGHVLEVFVILGVLSIHAVRSRLSRPLAWGLFVLVLIEVFLVGLSRVVLDAHYPSDAIAAAFGGGGVLGIYGLLTRDPEAKAQRHGD